MNCSRVLLPIPSALAAPAKSSGSTAHEEPGTSWKCWSVRVIPEEIVPLEKLPSGFPRFPGRFSDRPAKCLRSRAILPPRSCAGLDPNRRYLLLFCIGHISGVSRVPRTSASRVLTRERRAAFPVSTIREDRCRPASGSATFACQVIEGGRAGIEGAERMFAGAPYDGLRLSADLI